MTFVVVAPVHSCQVKFMTANVDTQGAWLKGSSRGWSHVIDLGLSAFWQRQLPHRTVLGLIVVGTRLFRREINPGGRQTPAR